jgi:hypothetical protein
MMRRMRAVVVVVGALMLGACGDQTVAGLDAFRRTPCRASPEHLAMIHIAPFAPAAMHSALLHGADAMSIAMEPSAHTRDLQDAMRAAAADIELQKFDSACRFVVIAADAVNAMADDPASRPDRVGVGLILALTAHALTTVIPQ